MSPQHRVLPLNINGKVIRFSVRGGETLLELLRSRSDLCGTRFGCGQEACGACMVLVDHKATFSCTFLAEDARDREIATVEGLGNADTPHPLQRAILAEQAGQCGYCLSGIMISAAALLRKTPSPKRSEIIAALEPHLCRCGSHSRIIRAIEHASRLVAEVGHDRE